ncbi:hypothetical protein GA0115242_14656 [Streptomyces sp. SolWspMP-5a-2]|nr:hypothetical protein GA0115242_14656 [Streptomyces sp. SolWspMP-5a-2]
METYAATVSSSFASASMNDSNCRWKESWSCRGTPSSSQIMMAGMGLAKAVTRSVGGPASAMASRCSAVICSTRSVSSRIRRTVNLPISGLR